MSVPSPTDNIFSSKSNSGMNATTQLQANNLQNLRDAKTVLATKKVTKNNNINNNNNAIKLRKKMNEPTNSSQCNMAVRKQMITTAVPVSSNTAVTSCYPYQDYNYPLTINDCQQLKTPVYTVRPMQVNHQVLLPPLGTVVQPAMCHLLPQTLLQENGVNNNVSMDSNKYNYLTGQMEKSLVLNEQSYYKQEEMLPDIGILSYAEDNIEIQSNKTDPMDEYFKLPKNLFPSAKMLALDPNPLIDEICKMPNLDQNAPWLLDLEFGVPKAPVTRAIPTYNVQYNSINCKNAPNAIHPGFESCEPEFKKVLLFYYDCIVSSWYNGYNRMYLDRSVDNFQSWLQIPMQDLGMCWP